MSTIQKFDFSVDVLSSLIWQYNSATKLESIIKNKQAWLDENQRDFWNNWARDVFNLRTANRFGLRVWSIILGIPLTIPLNPTGNKNKFGFGAFNKNFNRAPFGSIGSGSSGLTLEQARQILQLRYYKLVTRPTAYEINNVLQKVFGGSVYVQENTSMTNIVYVFNFEPTAQFENALMTLDVLPRPSTLGISIVFDRPPVFGFGEYNLNFNRGTFFGD